MLTTRSVVFPVALILTLLRDSDGLTYPESSGEKEGREEHGG